MIAFAVVLAACGAAWALGVFGGGRGAMGAQERALVEAFERKTGLALSLQKGELDAGAGSWRGLDVELRPRGVEGPLGRPLLSASVVELKLDTSALLRGEVSIEHALLHDAVLNLDRRKSAQHAIDVKGLLAALPASIDAPGGTVVVHEDRGQLTLTGIAMALQRSDGGARGTLDAPSAKLVFGADTKPVELALRSAFAWQPSGFALSALEVKRGASAFKGDGKLGGGDERVRLRADDARVADLAVWLEPFLGVDAKGQGRIELELLPSGASAKLELRDAAAHGIALSRIACRVERAGSGVRVRELVAAHGEASVRADELTIDAHGIESGVLHVERLSLRPALTGLFGSAPADGTARGTLTFARGDGESSHMRAELALDAPTVSGYRFDSGQLRGELELKGARAYGMKIEALELVGKTARLSAQGSASASGHVALDVRGQLSLGKEQLEGQGKVSGSWAQPETSATLGSSGSGPLALKVQLSGKDIREGTLELRSADFAARMPALEHAGAPHGVATARIALSRGRIDDVRTFEGQGELSAIALGYGEHRYKSTASVPLVLERGRIQLRGLTLVEDGAGSDTRWQLDGAIDLDRGFDLTARGQLALAALLETTPFIGAVEGKLDAKLTLDGPLDDPRLRGEAETKGAQLEVGPDKLPWREVQALVLLERNGLTFQRCSGKLGTGTLALGGSIGLRGVKPREVALTLALKRFEVSPEPRFDVMLEADSTLAWKAGDALPVLGGVVGLTRLHYGRHVQLPEAVIAIGRSKKPARAATVALDLYVTHSAPITIRNDFLDAELEISSKQGPGKAIHVVGTDTQIGALGELSVTRGRALFRGATLTIRHGRIALVSDDRIVPSLDLAADAPAKRRPGGLIAFRAKGDPQKFDLTLRCETKDGASVPPPFACDYAGDAMRCGAFEELTALWACQPPL